MTGISRVSGFDFSLRQTSKPSISGIITSRRMRSGFSAPVAISNALSPLVATLVLNESFSRPEITLILVGVSSTIRMSFWLEFGIAAFKFQLKARGMAVWRVLSRDFDHDLIASVRTAIPQIGCETFDKVNAQAAGLKLFQRLVDGFRRRLYDIEGSRIVFDDHRYSVVESVDGDRNAEG